MLDFVSLYLSFRDQVLLRDVWLRFLAILLQKGPYLLLRTPQLPYSEVRGAEEFYFVFSRHLSGISGVSLAGYDAADPAKLLEFSKFKMMILPETTLAWKSDGDPEKRATF